MFLSILIVLLEFSLGHHEPLFNSIKSISGSINDARCIQSAESRSGNIDIIRRIEEDGWEVGSNEIADISQSGVSGRPVKVPSISLQKGVYRRVLVKWQIFIRVETPRGIPEGIEVFSLFDDVAED